MEDCRYRQVLLTIAYYVLSVGLANLSPLLVSGLLKLIAFLVFACLLTFVVVHSATIRQAVTACLATLPSFSFALFIDARWVRRSLTTFVVPKEPNLSPLFQRPPPAFSF
jgi:hypothetical protein